MGVPLRDTRAEGWSRTPQMSQETHPLPQRARNALPDEPEGGVSNQDVNCMSPDQKSRPRSHRIRLDAEDNDKTKLSLLFCQFGKSILFITDTCRVHP